MNIEIKNMSSIKLTKSKDVFDLIRRIYVQQSDLERFREHFWVIGLSTALNKLVYVDLHSIGSNISCQVYAPELFRLALAKFATAIIVVHNHPSGRLVPSVNDKVMTYELNKIAQFLGLNFLDSIIISENRYYSFADKAEINKYSKEYFRSNEFVNFIDESINKNKLLECERNTRVEIASRLYEFSDDNSTILNEAIMNITGISEIDLIYNNSKNSPRLSGNT